jgi:hypothetical protein
VGDPEVTLALPATVEARPLGRLVWEGRAAEIRCRCGKLLQAKVPLIFSDGRRQIAEEAEKVLKRIAGAPGHFLLFPRNVQFELRGHGLEECPGRGFYLNGIEAALTVRAAFGHD